MDRTQAECVHFYHSLRTAKMQKKIKNGFDENIPLPMSRSEMKDRRWDQCDIIIITGDAYVDHPSFGAALIARHLESLGYKVGVIAQPDIRNADSFRILGTPKLFWGVTAGNVDSQLSRLTVMRKIRRDDPYTPGGLSGKRPPNASIVYTSLVKSVTKDIPVVLGGIEASLRTFAYYDYWTDKVRRSILFDAKADIIAYGMAEKAVAEIAFRLKNGQDIYGIPGTAVIRKKTDDIKDFKTLSLPSWTSLAKADKDGKTAFAHASVDIHKHHRPGSDTCLIQEYDNRQLVAYPPSTPLTPEELDRIYSLPFTRKPHPSYLKQRIPAYDMIKDSITIHRGCYADCSFCAITSHQGTKVTSRSMENILSEIEALAASRDFHGTISDLGGPTANMFGTFCRSGRISCPHRTCLYPDICKNLETAHSPLMELMKNVRQIKGVKNVFVTSGIRFDLANAGGGEPYIKELADHHVSGLLKIAPEHTSAKVLQYMRKPDAIEYRKFVTCFLRKAGQAKRKLSVVEYFMSGHPGCTLEDMIDLAKYLHANNIRPDQVQDFYPAPMTIAAAMYYTGLDPFTMKPIHVAKTDREKSLQRAILLCHKHEFHEKARQALIEAGHEELIGKGKDCLVPE